MPRTFWRKLWTMAAPFKSPLVRPYAPEKDLAFPSNLTILAVLRPNGHVEESVQDLVLTMKSKTPTLFTPLQHEHDRPSGSFSRRGDPTSFARSWAKHLRNNFASCTNQAVLDCCSFGSSFTLFNFSFVCATHTFHKSSSHSPPSPPTERPPRIQGTTSLIVSKSLFSKYPAPMIPDLLPKVPPFHRSKQ